MRLFCVTCLILSYQLLGCGNCDILGFGRVFSFRGVVSLLVLFEVYVLRMRRCFFEENGFVVRGRKIDIS